ncbi:MAG TPA: hypothetical protein VEX37_05870 [Thermomicrobiales bacterium]|nr:hypothetical protein [Thermomicrobiales bacterium]
MIDDLTMLRAAGIDLSDDEAARFIALRQHFAPARAALDAVQVGEVEPAVIFQASTSSVPVADKEASR